MRRLALPLFAAASVACSGSSTEPPPPPPPPAPPAAALGCATVADVALAVGASTVISTAAGSDCIRLSAIGQASEYLVVAASAAPERMEGGSTAEYRLMGRSASGAIASPPAPVGVAASSDPSISFHSLLRERERVAATRPRLSRRAPSLAAPQIGETRTFNVCQTTACNGFDPIVGRVRYVGRSVALYLEDSLPSDGYTDQEIGYYGNLFEQYLYPIDTTAYGRESDVDGNGLVIAFLTRGVNRLTTACTGGVIVGYFVGTDLLPGEAGSNGGEVLYSAVPDPNGEAGCRVTKDFTARALGPTLIHELQHLISYNQHVITRHGSAEESWLNEGLSHFAEELGARQIPNDWCVLNDCVSIFAVPDLTDAYRYLQAPEDNFLIYPLGSTGRLAERGAAWLFLRWVADHFGGSAAFTRGLLETGATGAANLSAQVGVPFPTLVGQWHLANWLDHLPGFAPLSDRLQYTSWDFRKNFASFHAQDRRTYPVDFPLAPDSIRTGFETNGLLRGGSGHYSLITVDPASSPYDIRLSGPGGQPLPLAARGIVAIARIK